MGVFWKWYLWFSIMLIASYNIYNNRLFHSSPNQQNLDPDEGCCNRRLWAVWWAASGLSSSVYWSWATMQNGPRREGLTETLDSAIYLFGSYMDREFTGQEAQIIQGSGSAINIFPFLAEFQYEGDSCCIWLLQRCGQSSSIFTYHFWIVIS